MIIALCVVGWILSGWLGLYLGYKFKILDVIGLGFVFLSAIYGPINVIVALIFIADKITIFERK